MSEWDAQVASYGDELSWFGSSLCPRRRRERFAVLCRRNQGDHLSLPRAPGMPGRHARRRPGPKGPQGENINPA
ncbi:hypothetical protein SSAG_00731 [Streptomyces sp. Mg1]|nr:hypothetical protein SSAG_00731 [Streptomyces sp. Mg1]